MGNRWNLLDLSPLLRHTPTFELLPPFPRLVGACSMPNANLLSNSFPRAPASGVPGANHHPERYRALCSARKDLSRNQPELELTDRVDALLRLSFADWTLAASQPSQSLPCSVSNTRPGAISQSAGCAHDRALSDQLGTVRLTKISWTVASFPKLLKFVGRSSPIKIETRPWVPHSRGSNLWK